MKENPSDCAGQLGAQEPAGRARLDMPESEMKSLLNKTYDGPLGEKQKSAPAAKDFARGR